MDAGLRWTNGAQAGNRPMYPAGGLLIQTAISSIATTAAGPSCQMNHGRGPLTITAAGRECTVDAAGLGYRGKSGLDRGFPGEAAVTLSAGHRCRLRLDASSGSGSARGPIVNTISGRITITSLISAILALILTREAGSFSTAGETSQSLTRRSTSLTSPTTAASLSPVAPIFSA